MFRKILSKAIFDAFVLEVISSDINITKEKIKKIVNNKNNKHKNIESQIYNITIDVLDEITFGKYKNKDILFDSAAELLNGFQKNKINNIEVLKFSLHKIVKHVDNAECNKFIKLLFHKLKKEEYKILYYQISSRKEEKSIKKYILDKYQSYKSDIKEEIGIQNIQEFKKVSCFRKGIKIIKFIIFNIGIVAGVLGIISFFSQSDNSIAFDNYQKGINYFEDMYFEDAEKCFESAYKINNDLYHLIYYYAYTEFMLENFNKSYKILVENKDSLNEDEMVILAMYEYKNSNYKKSKQYFDKIQEPEKLDIFAFYEYIDYTTKLGFLDNYGEGLNVICKNILFLEAKLNVVSVLPKITNKGFYNVNEFKIDEEKLFEILHRIEDYTIFEQSKCIRAESYMYFLLFYYSIQYDNIEVPTRYFSNIAQSLDYANNYDITKPLMLIMYIYISKLKLYPDIPEQMKEAFKIITEKYHKWETMEKEQGLKIQEKDKELLEIFEKIYKEMENNTFGSTNYDFVWESDLGYNEDNLLKRWARSFEYMVNYKGR